MLSGAPASSSSAAAPTTVAGDVERRCRAGLAAAAAALYGHHGEATAAALHARQEAGAASWPWLPGLCYRALAALDVTFPGDDRAAVIAGKALVGRPVRPDRLAAAVRELARAAPAAKSSPDPDLAAAVDGFWAELADVAAQLGRSVRAGDDDAVDRLLAQARPRLRRAARALQDAAQPPRPADSADGGEPEPEIVAVRPRSEPQRQPPPAPEAAPAPAPTRPEPATPAPAMPEPAVEGESLGPERPYAPLVFLGATVALSLLLLLAVVLGAWR